MEQCQPPPPPVRAPRRSQIRRWRSTSPTSAPRPPSTATSRPPHGRGARDPARARRGRGPARGSTGSTCSATDVGKPLRGDLRTRIARRARPPVRLGVRAGPRAARRGAVAVRRRRRRHRRRWPPTSASTGRSCAGSPRAGANRISGTFRAAVFGANDGLVSNLALVLGIGATRRRRPRPCCSPGLAGLLAGALSMGAGEYVSVRSQRELLEASAPEPGTPRGAARTSTSTPTSSRWSTARAGMTADEARGTRGEVLRDARRPRRGPTTGRGRVDEHEAVGTGVGRGAVELLLLRVRRRHPGAALPVRR